MSGILHKTARLAISSKFQQYTLPSIYSRAASMTHTVPKLNDPSLLRKDVAYINGEWVAAKSGKTFEVNGTSTARFRPLYSQPSGKPHFNGYSTDMKLRPNGRKAHRHSPRNGQSRHQTRNLRRSSGIQNLQNPNRPLPLQAAPQMVRPDDRKPSRPRNHHNLGER